jgi:hypothetical protein
LRRYADLQRQQEGSDRAALATVTAREREILQVLGDGLDSGMDADDQFAVAVRGQRLETRHLHPELAVLRA